MSNLLDNIQNRIPYTIYAGDTVKWKLQNLHNDYANNLYTLTYYFRLEGGGSTNFTVNASASSNDYLITLAHGVTAGKTAGIYNYVAYVTRASDSARITVDVGRITVKPNLATSSSETKSHAKIMLDKIESLLEGKADKDVASYSIAGRSLQKMSVTELLEWRNYYKAEYNIEVSKQRNANGDGSGNTIKVSFGSGNFGYLDRSTRKYKIGN